MKIAVMEDEIRIREGLSRLIKKLDPEYEVVGTAENGQEGIELARRENPDVIVTDIKMPLMDGLEMLTELYQEGYRGKAVVLSAYSEFEYARQAMKLGVKEYLLKPIVVNDISQALRNIKDEIRRENMEERMSITDIHQVFSEILWGNLKTDDTTKELLQEKYQITAEASYIELGIYLGSMYEEKKETVRGEIQRILGLNSDFHYICLDSERERMSVFLIYGYKDAHQIERVMQQGMLRWKEAKPFEGIGWNADLPLESLREGLQQIDKYMEWNISLGDEVLISYPKVTEVQTSPCIYPIDIEGQMKIHICANNQAGMEKDLRSFSDYFQKGKLYAPKEIKECYVRFLWTMMNVAKETGMLELESLDQQTLLEQIMGAKTRHQLNAAAGRLAEKISRKKENDTVHLTVKRAQSMIGEFYQAGITLEEIAAKLNITPEYLGTRFHKEMGVNFSTYIKNFRMSKAKELLIGTQLRLYEIAEKVGYSDPKYFSRVFKETTGQLPADYRKTHK